MVSIPVALGAWFQWRWSAEFIRVVTACAVLQILDGNVLVPLVFSLVVDLHPLAIIVAILVFGGIWGLRGVFFAIPPATPVQATPVLTILLAWPRRAPGGDLTVPARAAPDEPA